MSDNDGRGPALARQLCGELAGAAGALGAVAVRDRQEDATPTADGALYCRLVSDAGLNASVQVHPDHAHVEFGTDPEMAARAGERAGLRVRPKAVRPPRTLVFLESPDEVPAVLEVVEAVLE